MHIHIHSESYDLSKKYQHIIQTRIANIACMCSCKQIFLTMIALFADCNTHAKSHNENSPFNLQQLQSRIYNPFYSMHFTPIHNRAKKLLKLANKSPTISLALMYSNVKRKHQIMSVQATYTSTSRLSCMLLIMLRLYAPWTTDCNQFQPCHYSCMSISTRDKKCSPLRGVAYFLSQRMCHGSSLPPCTDVYDPLLC